MTDELAVYLSTLNHGEETVPPEGVAAIVASRGHSCQTYADDTMCTNLRRAMVSVMTLSVELTLTNGMTTNHGMS